MSRAIARARESADARKLLVLSGAGVSHLEAARLPELVERGDVFVVNDAATIPASLRGRRAPGGEPVELRLMRSLGAPLGGPENPRLDPRRWEAIVFGAGDWRVPTELRPLAAGLAAGDSVELEAGLRARVVALDREHPRLARVELEGSVADVWRALYRAGRPIQYSYLGRDLELWDQQTLFAGPPVSLEPPSAAFALSWGLVLDGLLRRGAEVVAVSHAAGIASTGDPELDARLPLPELSWMPEATARAIEAARARRRRVIAVGSSAARAVEGAALARRGRVTAGVREISHRLGPGVLRLVLSGMLTGMHEAGSSHLRMLESFRPREEIERAYRDAETRGYLWHEFGDVSLLLADEPGRASGSGRGPGAPTRIML